VGKFPKHTCEIIGAGGQRLLIGATRVRTDGALADFVIHISETVPNGQMPDGQARELPPLRLERFPRAVGVEGLFAQILGLVAREAAAAQQAAGATVTDEQGKPVEMPEPTPADWLKRGTALFHEARDCFKKAGVLDRTEIIDPEELEKARAAEQAAMNASLFGEAARPVMTSHDQTKTAVLTGQDQTKSTAVKSTVRRRGGRS
jgi:hypothetical protein